MRISDWSSDVCSSDLDEGRGHAINGNGERAVGARIDRFILPILPKSKDIADGEPAEVHGRVVADPDLPSIGMALAGREIAVGAVEIILLSLVISGKLAIDQHRDSRNRTGIKPINQANSEERVEGKKRVKKLK